MKFAVISTAFLLKIFALADESRDCILAILFSPPYFNNLDMRWANSLSSTFIATTMVMLFHKALFDVIVTLNSFNQTSTLEK